MGFEGFRFFFVEYKSLFREWEILSSIFTKLTVSISTNQQFCLQKPKWDHLKPSQTLEVGFSSKMRHKLNFNSIRIQKTDPKNFD